MAGDAVIVAGFGFRAAASAASLTDALRRADGKARARALATADDKAQTAVFTQVAKELGLPAFAIPAERLSTQATQTQSTASVAARGTGSVAEAAALAAAGPGARLLAARVISADGLATCALAEGETS